MEGLKTKLDKKRRELADLEKQMQREHERLAIDVVRSAFPADSRFSAHLSDIEIDRGQYLFSIFFDDDVTIFGHNSNLSKLLCVRTSYGKLEFEPTFTCATENWMQYNMNECEFLGLNDTDPLSTVIAKVARFWADVETALTIYISQMTNCPDESARPPHIETFTNEFGKLKHVE